MKRTPGIHHWMKGALVVVSYTAGISEDIRWVCRKYVMMVIFRSGVLLRSVLTKVEDTLPMKK